MDEKQLIEVGDRMRLAIQQAVIALMNGDEKAVWDALDAGDGARACLEWDRLMGRDVPSDAEIEAGRQRMIADLKRSLEQPKVPLSELF
jgi:hypothetical protein